MIGGFALLLLVVTQVNAARGSTVTDTVAITSIQSVVATGMLCSKVTPKCGVDIPPGLNARSPHKIPPGWDRGKKWWKGDKPPGLAKK